MVIGSICLVSGIDEYRTDMAKFDTPTDSIVIVVVVVVIIIIIVIIDKRDLDSAGV